MNQKKKKEGRISLEIRSNLLGYWPCYITVSFSPHITPLTSFLSPSVYIYTYIGTIKNPPSPPSFCFFPHSHCLHPLWSQEGNFDILCPESLSPSFTTPLSKGFYYSSTLHPILPLLFFTSSLLPILPITSTIPIVVNLSKTFGKLGVIAGRWVRLLRIVWEKRRNGTDEGWGEGGKARKRDVVWREVWELRQ